MLDTTVGGTTSNSYGTLEEANTYFANRLYAEKWTAATDPVKEQALKMATTMLDDNFSFSGRVLNIGQVLAWPRSGAYDREARPVSFIIVPEKVKEAQFELALSLLTRDRTAESALDGLGLNEVKIGPIEFKVGDNASEVMDPLTDVVLQKLSGLGESNFSGRNQITMVPILRS